MILLIIAGMSLATMLPRLIPVFIVEKLQFRPWLNRMLSAIPFAALGALIFPGIITVIPEQPHIGIIGGIVAVLLSFLGLNVIFVVIGAIAAVYLMLSI
jgi:branched-subunit amino acid transport protein